MTAAEAVQPVKESGDGQHNTDQPVSNDSTKKKRNYVRKAKIAGEQDGKNKSFSKNGRKKKTAPVIPINGQVAEKLEFEKEKNKNLERFLNLLNAPQPLGLPEPVVEKKRQEKIMPPPAVRLYNKSDTLYLLSRLTVGNVIIRDNSEPKEHTTTISSFVYDYVVRYNLPNKPSAYKTYHQQALTETLKERILKSESKKITEADVLNAALQNHAKTDPNFEKLPNGVFITGSDLQNKLQEAAYNGVILDEFTEDSVEVTDPFKTGKRRHGIEQGSRYASAIIQEVEDYWDELCVPYMSENYWKTAFVLVREEENKAVPLLR